MYKRPLFENGSEEADSSEISQPTTKIIRIDDNPTSSFSDKCIQVDANPICNDEQSLNEKANENHESNESLDIITSEIPQPTSSTDTNCSLESIDFASTSKDESPLNTYLDNDTSSPSSNSPQLPITPSLDVCASSNSDIVSKFCSAESQPLNDDEIKTAELQVEINDESSNSNASVLSSNTFYDETATTSSTTSDTDSKVGPVQGVLKVPGRKPKIKRSVIFNGVTVYYFRRSQGFTCIPSQGGSTLGMENTHSHFRNFTLESHAEERKKTHREILMRQRRFAKLSKNSSTSESEDDSCDDLSDFSDVDLENDSCYFLQPVPIKQRRALLRASGVRKIETGEKEDCRDIRLSREFCGCDCQIYCNPEVCSCHQAGIKCQVDRMSFPCGCTREGCSNTNGRIEFNPLRVRTHFIHTIMKVEMDKKQIQQEQDLRNSSNLSSTDSYCANPGNYNPQVASQCNQPLPSQELYLPMQNNHYVPDSPHMLMPGSSSNNFSDPSCVNIFNTDYSPDNSSYSENSDYTSDDFEEELTEKHDDSKPHGMYSHQSGNYIATSQDMMHMMSSIPQVSSIGSTSSTVLPPFPSINSSCDISSSSSGNYKESHSHPYQDAAMHLNPYSGSYSPMTDNMTSSSQHTSVYSYDIHTPPSHYNYTEGFHKEDNFAPVSTNHLSSTEPGSGEHLSTPQLVNNDHNLTQQQQYIDLSLSIASSSSAESLLSAANTSDEDSRLTPISFTHIQPLSSSSSFYSVTTGSVNPCEGTFEPGYSAKGAMPACQAQYIESDEVNRKSESVENLSNENFGEIIKKSIVESVSA